MTVDTWRLRSIERASTTEQVLTELRDAIVDGRIPQGEQLPEVALSRELGTGRSAVREALRQLVQEGLVEHQMHRGAVVRIVSLEDRLDVYGAREAIEAGAVRHYLDRDEPADLSPLRDALEDLRRAFSHSGDVTDEAIAADIRFHQELVGLCGSPRLSRAHATLAAETRMLLRHHPVYPAADYVSDHEVLLDALERRDPGAQELVVQHLRLSARLIGEEIAREAAETPDGEAAEGETAGEATVP